METTTEQTETDETDHSDSSNVGRGFTPENADDHRDASWRSRRERQLREHGAWRKYGAVPPKEVRGDTPHTAYLPGGEKYDE